MSPEVQSIVEQLGLENARIQVGRERIYPPRSGLSVSPTAIEILKTALASPDAVKGTVKITQDGKTLFWVSKGVVNTPLETQLEAKIQQESKMQAQAPPTDLNPAKDPELSSASAQTQAENVAARATYFELLSQHSDFQYQGITTHDELLDRPTNIQQQSDQFVMAVALGKGLPREQLDRVIAQGSPYIQGQLDTGSLTQAREYLTQESGQYHQKLQSSQDPVVEKQFDYPSDAQTLDPAKEFRDTLIRGASTVQTTAIAAKENLELAQKNLATFAKQVKHRGFKAWAKDQMPILKQKALEIAADQGTKLREWAQEAAPVVKEAVVTTAKDLGQKAAVIGKQQGIKLGHWANDQAPVVKEALVSKARVVGQKAVGFASDVGATALGKIEAAVTPVDIPKIEQGVSELIDMLGRNGTYEGVSFNFYRTEQGIQVNLKDGKPILQNGQLDRSIGDKLINRLNNIPNNIREIKQNFFLQPAQPSHSAGARR